ncbi:sulfur carrier protein ThiS [Parapedobacter koreensis]|uniref:Sulfur carrier protein ThiS n=1 Tax=Parapedobacter koreensis TaxID=332977 RepID=A0A1H7SRX5_9SPHI|nr:sulfur carrier protein ThiS [Parapedobacter koreensis]SEL74644.1 sulfur carrier protein ThiS [Parapedobacter koreensis]
MEITINQQTVSVNQGISLAAVLSDYGVQEPKGVAVAVNETVVPQKHWHAALLQPNDRLTIIKAAQGG